MCNLSEYYEEIGYEIGYEMGVKIGAAKERFSAIERMLKAGKIPEQIAVFCGYALEEVLIVQQKLSQLV